MEITTESIRKAIDKLIPYKLYGSKEQIEQVREILPVNVEAIEVPEGYLPDKDKMILIDIRDLNSV
jgi:hypothetical protein